MFAALALATSLFPGSTLAAQVTEHEYRPELILTTPSYRQVGVQLLVEQHLQTSDLFPNERILGVGLTTKPIYGLRFSLEARQIATPTYLEHRYIPTVFSTRDLGDGFEIRSRTRVEFRDIATVWSRRYQDRTAFGKVYDVSGHEVFSYTQLDVSYDSRFHTVNRIDKSIGTRYYMTKEVSMDLFFGRQDNSRQAPQILYASSALPRIAL